MYLYLENTTKIPEVGSNKVHLRCYIYLSKSLENKRRFKGGHFYFNLSTFVTIILHFNFATLGDVPLVT